MEKHVYIKAYTKKNVGDDLFVFILCNRYPHVEFYLKKAEPYTNVFKNIKNLTLIDNQKQLSYDAIIYIGGSIFIESSPLSVTRLLDLKKEIIKEDIPSYIIGANFGPYISDEYFTSAKEKIFPYLKQVTFRDKYSYNLFQNLKNIKYAPDIVFSLNTSNIKKEIKKEIGISIIHHLDRPDLKKYYNNYINKLLEICKYYIQKNYKIRLFSFCEYEKDLVAINNLLNKMTEEEKEHTIISNYNGNIEEIINDIANLDLFITSRFHSIILGLKLNIPIIPICYSLKSTNVLNDIKFPQNRIYTFKNIDSLNNYDITEIFKIELTNQSEEHFKDLDKILAL